MPLRSIKILYKGDSATPSCNDPHAETAVNHTLLQNAIDVPLLAEYFPGQPALAYFEFSPGLTHATSQVVQDALDLKAAGLAIDPAELSEKTGYTLEESK